MPADLSFTPAELLALLGLAQCVYLLVHMGLRAGRGSHAALPAAYFATLGAALFVEMARGSLAPDSALAADGALALWLALPPLAALLVVQLATIPRGPRWRDAWLLAPAAIALPAAFLAPQEMRPEWLGLGGFMAGTVALGGLMARERLLRALRTGPDGAQRYLLALALIGVSAGLLAAVLAWLTGTLAPGDFALVRTILGLGLAYLAMTSVLRIYPQAVRFKAPEPRALSEADAALAARIEGLLERDKVYHEPAYGRAEMARELGVGEAQISRVVTAHFGDPLPRLLNARRVADAQRLLAQTNAPVQTIAGEIGFGSLASFNRVFREVAGTTPSAYRAANQDT